MFVIVELEALKHFCLLPQSAAVRCVAYTTRRSETYTFALQIGRPEVTKHSLPHQNCSVDDSGQCSGLDHWLEDREIGV